MFRILSLLTLLSISALLTSCNTRPISKDEPVDPVIWTVQKGVENVPAYDGVCGKADEFIVTRIK